MSIATTNQIKEGCTISLYQLVDLMKAEGWAHKTTDVSFMYSEPSYGKDEKGCVVALVTQVSTNPSILCTKSDGSTSGLTISLATVVRVDSDGHEDIDSYGTGNGIQFEPHINVELNDEEKDEFDIPTHKSMNIVVLHEDGLTNPYFPKKFRSPDTSAVHDEMNMLTYWDEED